MTEPKPTNATPVPEVRRIVSRAFCLFCAENTTSFVPVNEMRMASSAGEADVSSGTTVAPQNMHAAWHVIHSYEFSPRSAITASLP